MFVLTSLKSREGKRNKHFIKCEKVGAGGETNKQVNHRNESGEKR